MNKGTEADILFRQGLVFFMCNDSRMKRSVLDWLIIEKLSKLNGEEQVEL